MLHVHGIAATIYEAEASANLAMLDGAELGKAIAAHQPGYMTQAGS